MCQKGFSGILVLAVISLSILIAFYTGYISFNQNNPTQVNNPPSIFKDSEEYPQDPRMVAQNFYSWYVNCLSENGNIAECDYKKSRYISQELTENLTTILCAQDLPDNNIQADQLVLHGDRAFTIVHTHYSESGDNPLDVRLRLIDNKWQIVGISCLTENSKKDVNLQPEEVVGKFYLLFFSFWDGRLKNLYTKHADLRPDIDYVHQSPFASSQFKQDIDKTATLPYSPLECAQNSIGEITINSVHVKDEAATVVVTEFKPHQFEIHLTHSSAGWKIISVQCPPFKY